MKAVIPKPLEESGIWQSRRTEFDPAKRLRSSPTSASWAMQAESKSGMTGATKNRFFKWFGYIILLLFLFLPLDGEETTVTSDQATYDGNEVNLEGHVTVEHVMGQLSAGKARLRKDDSKPCPVDFPWIEAHRDVIIQLADGSVIHCENTLIDYMEKKSLFTGLPQVYFCDEEKKIYADEARIDFSETKNGKILPLKITLKGQVQMVKLDKDQQAAAEWVEYYPQEARILFRGNPALFYDPSKEMQLSAQTIWAQKDAETGKEKIQGMGRVRFSFKQEEYLKLKERLHWEKQKEPS